MREIRILLVGKTGSGKSSVGNTILGRDVFNVAHNTQSCTTTFEKATFLVLIRDLRKDCGEWELRALISDWLLLQEAILCDTKYVVVDTPGIHDTHTPTIQQIEAFIHGCIKTSPGFHIIAFVLKRGDKYTAEIQETQRRFFEWFGNDVDTFSCLIMTHTKDDEEKELYMTDPHKDFKLLLERTHGNLAIFENKGASHEKEKQVNNCINLLERIVARNNGKCFDGLIFYLLQVMEENFDIDDSVEYIKQRLGSKYKDDGFAEFMRIVESLTDINENEPQLDTDSVGRLMIIDESQYEETNTLRIYNEDNTRYQPNLDNANKSRDSQRTARSENCTASIEPRTASIEDNPQHHTPVQKQLQAKDTSADRLGMDPEEEANTSFVHTSSSDYFGKKYQTDESESMGTKNEKRTSRSKEKKNANQGCIKSSEEITCPETKNKRTGYMIKQVIDFLKWIWGGIQRLFQTTPIAVSSM